MKPFTHKHRSEVDLRVAQELKNNQDFLYQTNQSLQALSEGIKSLSNQHEKVMAKSGSDAKALLIVFENLRDEIASKINHLHQSIGNAEKQLFDVLGAFKELKDDVQGKYLLAEDFIKTTEQHDEAIDRLGYSIVEKHNYFNIAIDALRSQFKDKIEQVRKDLTPRIPEVDPVQQKIDERFQVFKVDFDGLIKEIALLKKAVAYDQKKFENLYMLIERLKGKVS